MLSATPPDGRDESGTLARLRKNHAERLDPYLALYGGRLAQLPENVPYPHLMDGSLEN
jgi:hypothetical protein